MTSSGLFVLLALALVPPRSGLDNPPARGEVATVAADPLDALDPDDRDRLDASPFAPRRPVEAWRALEDELDLQRWRSAPRPRDGAVALGLAVTVLSADRPTGQRVEVVVRAVLSVELGAWLEVRPEGQLGPPRTEVERTRRCLQLGRWASTSAGDPVRRAREGARWRALGCAEVRP